MLRKLTNELEAAQSRKLFQVLRTETQIFRGWSREELFALADAIQISGGEVSALWATSISKILYLVLFTVIVGPMIWNFKKKLALKK